MTASSEALERSPRSSADAPAKRMLVIVNPYATTMSDRLKSLVVYALQGRYEVDGGRHRSARATRPSSAARPPREGYDVVVAFGGDGTVNEAANGLAGSRHAADLPARRLHQRLCQACSASPTTSSTPPSTCCALADALGAARGRPRRASTAAASRSPPASGLDASVVERVDRHPRLKAALRPVVLRRARRSRTFLAQLRRQPAAARGRGRRAHGRRRHLFVQNAEPYTYFKRPPGRAGRGRALDSGDLAGVVLDARAARSTCRRSPSGRCPARRGSPSHRRVDAFGGVQRGCVVRSTDDRPIPLQVDGDHIGERARGALRGRARARCRSSPSARRRATQPHRPGTLGSLIDAPAPASSRSPILTTTPRPSAAPRGARVPSPADDSPPGRLGPHERSSWRPRRRAEAAGPAPRPPPVTSARRAHRAPVRPASSARRRARARSTVEPQRRIRDGHAPTRTIAAGCEALSDRGRSTVVRPSRRRPAARRRRDGSEHQRGHSALRRSPAPRHGAPQRAPIEDSRHGARRCSTAAPAMAGRVRDVGDVAALPPGASAS